MGLESTLFAVVPLHKEGLTFGGYPVGHTLVHVGKWRSNELLHAAFVGVLDYTDNNTMTDVSRAMIQEVLQIVIHNMTETPPLIGVNAVLDLKAILANPVFECVDFIYTASR